MFLAFIQVILSTLSICLMALQREVSTTSWHWSRVLQLLVAGALLTVALIMSVYLSTSNLPPLPEPVCQILSTCATPVATP